MQWMDIKVKDLKVQINNQCVTDAKTELEVTQDSHPGC
jgi:hypothetical protein